MLKPGQHIHFVGIGGIGMSGIAELMSNFGYDVSGSDLKSSSITDRLKSLGVKFNEGHRADHITDADLIVVSSAVPVDNTEWTTAIQAGIPTMSRGDMLAEITHLKRSVAVVGSHGKTTTTAMIALVLEAAGFDPTALIGGVLSTFGSNARLGHGPLIVVEADESDRSFLRLSPEIGVLTNIDEEHLDAYDNMSELEDSFVEFSNRVSSNGCVVACLDDLRLNHLLSRISGKCITYGISNPSSHIYGTEVVLGPTSSHCHVQIAVGSSKMEVDLHLSVPGRHNVQNALAAFSVGIQLAISPEKISKALKSFVGVNRRFQVHDEIAGVVVIDDYGHHPTEIETVLQTARLRVPSRLRVIFQPHRYSRTKLLLHRFGEVLARADELILTEVYPASEAPIPGATAQDIVEAVNRVSSIPVRLVNSLEEIAGVVVADSRIGDVVVILGAGSIGNIVPQVIEGLQLCVNQKTSQNKHSSESEVSG